MRQHRLYPDLLSAGDNHNRCDKFNTVQSRHSERKDNIKLTLVILHEDPQLTRKLMMTAPLMSFGVSAIFQ